MLAWLVGGSDESGNEKSRRHWIWDDRPFLITVAFIIVCVVIGLELFFYMLGD
jgi:hypothetical protein